MKRVYYDLDMIIGWLAIAIGVLCLLGAFLLLMAINPAVGRELVIASTYNDGTRDPRKMTAAHKTLPLGTIVRLKHYHRVLDVVINDRGPFVKGRTFDLTPAANKFLQCGGLCRLVVEPWPPLPKPRPDDMIAWGEE